MAVVGSVATAGAVGTATTAPRVDVGTKHAALAVQQGTLPVKGRPTVASSLSSRRAAAAAAAAPAEVGEKRFWLYLDDAGQFYDFAEFTLRAIGQHIEVWVQTGETEGGVLGTDFPGADCRNDGTRNVVTDEQIADLVTEFDNTIYPKESAVFSVPPNRDGANAALPGLVGLPPDYYSGPGDKIVTLVSNVRDTNFYDPNNGQGLSYIAGFFSSQLNDYFDRNVMTIDAWDWLHRTGANPPDDPVPGDLCASAPARPRLYEGVFAHEYQHLLEHYEDADEVNWINEGLADWAQTLVGYVEPGLPITDKGFDSHIQCFTGYLSVETPVNPNPRAACGPENSLTRWGDQGDGEILADYGAAYSMMELLQGRYGNDFMTALHRGDANGFAGVDEALGSTGHRGRHEKATSESVFDDWTLAVALDGLVDQGYRIDGRVKERDVGIPTLRSTILWTTPEAYSSPGAPSNGSDYVQLRNGSGTPLGGDQIDTIAFKGDTTLPTAPLAWTTVADPPGHAGDPALYSGTGVDRDEAAVTPVTVPAGGTLTFDALWDLETLWDYAFVQVSTDGGATYTSQACTGPTAADSTTDDHDPGAVNEVVSKLPGFTGVSGGSGAWVPISCDLSAFGGQNVLVAFRVVNDPAVEGNGVVTPPGFYVDNVAIEGTPISDGSSTAPFKSLSETRPAAVTAFTVSIVSIETDRKRITVKQLPLTSDFTIRGKARVQRYVEKRADFVAAIVTFNDPGETATQYARYALTVNGVVQPGGA